jgi:hypothetical protein
MDRTECPLCGRNTDRMGKLKILYGHTICRDCYFSFANKRQLAFFIDIVFWRILSYPLAYVLGYTMGTIGFSMQTITVVGYMLTSIFLCKDCFSGRSPGKAITGVQAIDKTSGIPIGLWASFKRNLPLIIPFMPLVVAFELCKGTRTGDGWANSKVIWKKYASNPVFLPESEQHGDKNGEIKDTFT